MTSADGAATDGPLHLQVDDESTFADTYARLQGAYDDARVWRVRGAKMRSQAGAFDEIGAALQFPYYFGANWHALDDCLTDLAWAPASDYLLLVCDAHLVLDGEDPGRFGSLLRCLVHAHEVWAAPHSFRTVLQVPPGVEAELRSRLADAGHPLA